MAGPPLFKSSGYNVPAPGDDIRRPQMAPHIILPDAPPRAGVNNPFLAPWNAVALISLYREGLMVSSGTGFLCRPDVLLTAGHVVTESNGFQQAGVWLGFDGHNNPHPPSTPIAGFRVHPTLDLAVFILAGKQLNNFELGAAPPPQNSPVTLAGYGFPYPDNMPMLSEATGPTTQLNVAGASLHYRISSRPGDSGAPVFVIAPGNIAWAIGVHTDAADDVALGNGGIFLSAAVVQEVDKIAEQVRGGMPGAGA